MKGLHLPTGMLAAALGCIALYAGAASAAQRIERNAW